MVMHFLWFLNNYLILLEVSGQGRLEEKGKLGDFFLG